MDPLFAPIYANMQKMLQDPNLDESRRKEIEAWMNAMLNGDYRTLKGLLANQPGVSFTPEGEAYYNSKIEQQGVNESRAWEEEQASTDLIKQANQLKELGLSSSGVLQTGGSSVNAVQPATSGGGNVALDRFKQGMSMAKSAIGLVQSMSNAGIYGHALVRAKQVASEIGTKAADKGSTYFDKAYKVLSQHYDRKTLLQMMGQ